MRLVQGSDGRIYSVTNKLANLIRELDRIVSAGSDEAIGKVSDYEQVERVHKELKERSAALQTCIKKEGMWQGPVIGSLKNVEDQLGDLCW